MATSAVKITTNDNQTFEHEFNDTTETIAKQLATKITELEKDGHWVNRVEMRPIDNTPES